MANKLPQIFAGSKICIICEGDEEFEYLERLISLDVWSKNIVSSWRMLKEMEIFLRDIKINFRTAHTIWF